MKDIFKKSRKWLALLLTTVTQPLVAQFNPAHLELGIYGGGSHYYGELNHQGIMRSHLAFGLVGKYDLSLRHSLRMTAFYGHISGDDANARKEIVRNRNLNFSSSVLELAVGYEVNWFRYRIHDMKYPVTPYFFYQIGLMHFNPVTSYQGNEVALQPLGTEGQGSVLNKRKNYRLNQLVIPLGVGCKFNLHDRWALAVEYGIRKTFTDYLDDVSGAYVDPDLLAAANGPLAATLSNRSLDETVTINRGNPSNKDWYAFYGFTLTFKPFKTDVCKTMKGR